MKQSQDKLQDVPFMDVAWIALREVEKTYKVYVEVEIIPQPRKGIWLIHVMASDMLPGVNFTKPVARIRLEFPNGRLTTFAGTMYDLMLSLDRLVRDYRTTFGPRPQE